jgi:hypothetical protein
MRIFKLIIISFVILFAIITVISLFIPSNIQISKAIQINAPKNSVMAQISDPVNWKNWYPSTDLIYVDRQGVMLDSVTALRIKTKKDDEVIANYAGAGSKDISTGWKVIPAAHSVAVHWYMNFHLSWYPWEKFSSLLLEKRYGPVMEQGLNNLKNYLENNRLSNN